VIANLTKMLDEINRIYAPGIEVFYAKHEPDLWVASVNELEQNISGSNSEVTLKGIAIYKLRRQKMLEVYKAFMELSQAEYRHNPVIDAIMKNLYADASEQTTRALIRCDACEATAATGGPIRVAAVDRDNENGDPATYHEALCRPCYLKRSGK
jgi:hypothetical protein